MKMIIILIMRSNTKAREAILNLLQTHTDRQFTAEEMADELADSGLRIPIATIYRTLVFFEDRKLIKKFVVPNSNRACYQGIPEGRDCSKHYHLKCNTCGKLLHQDCDAMAAFVSHLENEHGFVVDLGQTVFYGTCVECRRMRSE